jgi:LmbE family N-acetylglucosaminyl deacetylase
MRGAAYVTRMTRRFAAFVFVALLAALLAALPARAQERGAPRLDQLVRGLATMARVLVVAAHPDDEDTWTIAWLARGKHVETAYLSLTRGDGGQNVIGNDLGDGLGAIRTEELLAARRVDGGRQFFTRAYDFGFSKTAEETAKHWPRDSILGDVVTVIRAYRPHLIYSIWNGTRADGHGQHEFAGQVAREAFDAAGDTVRFPVKKYGEPWQPLKYYNRGAAITLPFNDYDAVQGRTYADIAIESRSQHRSQGLADLALRTMGGRGGPVFGAVVRTATRVNAAVEPAAERSIFDGIDTSFARLVASAPEPVRQDLGAVALEADSAQALLDFRDPARVVPVLARLAAHVQAVRAQVQRCWFRMQRAGFLRPNAPPQPRCTPGELDLDAALETLERRATQAVLAAAELQVDAFAPREFVAFGDSTPVAIRITNHGRAALTIADLRVTGSRSAGFAAVTLRPDSTLALTRQVIGLPDARPWWLGGREEGLFAAKQSPFDGLARVSATSDMLLPGAAVSEEQRRLTEVRLTLEVAGVSVVINAGQVLFRSADALLGIQDRPLAGVPSVTLEFDRNLEWLPAGKPIDRMLRVTVKSFADGPRTFALRLVAPPGLTVDSMPPSLTIAGREQREIVLRLRGALKAGRHEFGIVGTDPQLGNFAEGFSSTIYPHIRPIHRFRTSGLYLNAVDIEVPARLSVAYVQGVGDDNAVYLRQLGVPVTIIQPGELPAWDLSRFSTVVIGTRAFDANRSLAAFAPRLLDFARGGGTLIVQYGQNLGLTPQVFPFPLAWQPTAERVTVEDAPVTVLDPGSRLLGYPNRIADADWKGWAQERALYMPSTIDPRYQALLEMHDPGEKENRGAILTAPVGKGVFVYTSLSLFRQLPGAVPGGARLFVNLLSAGSTPATRPTP